ncbi:MAG: hypothetical protein NC203_04755 [Firmicutes bacterium]|nr:hypothetical protein [[Eubacterium] siraeum]MCM1487659.1 hypothetical protein [Bacillota bacterium]
MKDNDIKKVFADAIDGGSTNINTEKIQNTVMERLGKQARDNLKLADTEETVSPVFVTAPKKNSRSTVLKITAGAAAACLGLTAVSVGFANGFGSSQITALSEGGADGEIVSDIQTDVSDISDISDTSEDNAVDGGDSEYAKSPVSNTAFSFLDGTTVRHDYISNSTSFDTSATYDILKEDTGRLYLLFSEIAKHGDGDDLSDMDLTDYIDSDTPYTSTFTFNPDNVDGNVLYAPNKHGDILEHIFAVGGDVGSNDYGYAILSKIRYTDDWTLIGKFSGNAPQLPNGESDSGKPQWLINAVKKVQEDYPDEVINVKAEEISENVDFKAEIPVVNCVPDMSDYSYNKRLYENPDVEFCLLDGTLVQCVEEENMISCTSSMNPNYPICSRDGKLYYTGNGTKENITDIISDGGYFVTSYINSVTGFTHYIIVGGDLENNDYGYIDLYKLSEDGMRWETSYTTHCGELKNALESDSGSLLDAYRNNWFGSIEKKISKTLEASYPGTIIGGGGGTVDFSLVN